MASLILGIRLSLYDFQRVRLENVDFETKIDQFKVEVSKKANLPKESLGMCSFVYCIGFIVYFITSYTLLLYIIIALIYVISCCEN